MVQVGRVARILVSSLQGRVSLLILCLTVLELLWVRLIPVPKFLLGVLQILILMLQGMERGM